MSQNKPKAMRWSIGQPAFEADRVCPLMPVWPWGGHRAWAYDLVRFMRPRVIGELGVHWGTSLFAFAQAVKDERIDARLIGVDTWSGDGHTGPYGPDVLQTVRRIAGESYPQQKFELHQMTFDEALPKVTPASIDLLHIDGFHTYDAVKHDFETWLPTLAPNGIILLHDVAEDTGYGSVRYFEELCRQFPAFHFQHSWGLGVVFPKGDKWLRLLRQNGLEDKVLLYTYREQLARAKIELRDTGELAVSRMSAMEDMGRTIAEGKEREAVLAEQVARQIREAEAAARLAIERLGAIEEMGRTIYEHQQREIAAKGELELVRVDLAAAGTLAVERLAAMEDMGRKIYEHQQREIAARAEIASITGELVHARLEWEAAKELAVERLAAMEDMGRKIYEHQQQEIVARGELEIVKRDLAAAGALAVERLDAMRLQGERHLEELGAVRAHAGALGDRVAELEARLAEADTRGEALRAELMEKQAMINELHKSIDDLRADVELIAMRLEHLERLEIAREKGVERASTRKAAGAGAKPESGRKSKS